MIIFKDGVSLFGLQPEILWAIDRAYECSPSEDMTVTGTRYDEKPSRASLHNVGHAVDLRTRHLNIEQIRAWVLAIKETLGRNYDVIYEGNHIHIEYQAKGLQPYPRVQP